MTHVRTIVLVGLLIAGIGASGFFGYRLATGPTHEDSTTASVRDAALRQGSAAVTALSTLHHRDAESGLRDWETASTGSLRTHISQSRRALLAAVARSRTATSAHVVRAALTTLDVAGGRARMMALVDVLVAADGRKAETKRTRLIGDLSLVGDRWLLSALAPMTASEKP